jgi:hypothetical protein
MRLGRRIDDGGRECLDCGAYKPWADYYTKSNGTRGHQSECKPCHREIVRQHGIANPGVKAGYARRWREENPVRYQEGQVRQAAKRHGLDPVAVVAHFRQHHGACDICGGTPSGGDRRTSRLCIDHDHLTGEFRGLLCTACNTAIGKFKDDPEILAAAIRYLMASRERQAA